MVITEHHETLEKAITFSVPLKVIKFDCAPQNTSVIQHLRRRQEHKEFKASLGSEMTRE